MYKLFVGIDIARDSSTGHGLDILANNNIPDLGYTRIQNVLNKRFCVNGDCSQMACLKGIKNNICIQP